MGPTPSLARPLTVPVRHGRAPSRLVGRDDDLAVLVARLQTAPSLTVVEGEAGVGKTRLVEAALEHPAVGGVARLVGNCRPLQDPLPLAPVVEALAHAAGKLTDTDLGPVAGVLRPLLPELASELPPPPDPVESAAVERQRLFRGATEVIAALAPAVLALEDLHWMDRLTAEFLRHLVDHRPPGVAVVATFRPEDLATAEWAWLARPGAPTRRILLEPFTVEVVGELVGALLGTDDVSEAFASYVHRSTAGLPFAVEEVVRLLAEKDEVLLRDGQSFRRSALTVPPAVRDLVLARLARLPQPAQQVADALAVLARPSTLPLVAGTTDLSEERAVDGLVALDHARLLSDDRGRYDLRHDLARQACYQAIPSPRRRWLHARAGAALATRPDPPLAELAHHHREAGDAEAWLRHAEAAAEVAADAGNHAAAVRLLEDTLDATADRVACGRLAGAYAIAAVQARLHRQAIPVIRRVVEEGDLEGEARGRLGSLLSAMLAQSGDLPAATAEARRAVREYDGAAEAAVPMSYLAWPLSPDVHVDEHLEWLRSAVALRPHALEDAAAIRAGVGDAEGWALGKRLLHAQAESLEPLRLMYNLADAALRTGHYPRAERILATLGERMAEAQTRRYAAPAAGLALWLDWARGHWDGLADRAAALLAQDEDSPTAGTASTFVRGAVTIAGGAPTAGVRLLAEVADTAIAAGEPVLHLWACGELARVNLARGRIDLATTYGERGLQLVRSKGIWAWCGEPLPWSVAALIRAGDHRRAAAVLREADHGLRGVDAPSALAALTFADGLLTAASDQPDRAHRRLADVAQTWDVMPRPHLAALARAELGRVVSAANPEHAIAVLTDAHDRLASIGARWDAAHVRRLLRELGVRDTHRRGRRGYGTDLSPREREVAELAAAGCPNREIAERLVLSLRTVEHHMSAVLSKLGVPSRDRIVL